MSEITSEQIRQYDIKHGISVEDRRQIKEFLAIPPMSRQYLEYFEIEAIADKVADILTKRNKHASR